jgi:hypothetical protein
MSRVPTIDNIDKISVATYRRKIEIETEVAERLRRRGEEQTQTVEKTWPLIFLFSDFGI